MYLRRIMRSTFVVLVLLLKMLRCIASDAPWIPYNGHCFLLYRNEISWSDAQLACRKDGGDLVSIRNVEDQSFVISHYRNFWIGLSAPDQGTGYVWSDGSPVNFLHWADGQPNNKNNVESCVEFIPSNWHKTGSWNDKQCEAYNRFICQIPTATWWQGPEGG
uniref:C-type lectin domain-containing protein n=1 Tax=Fundulus heteroclitus TaxID=8078 RepID=A0A3Q2STN8_FUNHE